MVTGDRSGEAPVHLFWPGRIDIAGPQTRFYMADRYLLVVGSQGRCHGSDRIAVHKDKVGTNLFQYWRQPLEHITGNIS